MSDCPFGVSPVNYPDPDPEHTEQLFKRGDHNAKRNDETRGQSNK